MISSCLPSKEGKQELEAKVFLHDEEIGLDRKNFKEALSNSTTRLAKKTKEIGEAPELPEIFQYPEIPDFAEGKLVSIKVTEDIPLKDILIELARLAEVEIEIDPYITGGVIIIAKNRPFSQYHKTNINLS